MRRLRPNAQSIISAALSRTVTMLRESRDTPNAQHGSEPQNSSQQDDRRQRRRPEQWKNDGTSPFTANNYRPHFSNVDVIDLLIAVGLWRAVGPIVLARSGCPDEVQLRELLSRAEEQRTPSPSSSPHLFHNFNQFSPLFSSYFTFEDKQMSTAGELVLHHYLAESIADYTSYSNLVLSTATVKQLGAAVVNYYSLRLWAEDGCGLSRFLSAPPMLENEIGDSVREKRSRLGRHQQLSDYIVSLRNDTSKDDATSGSHRAPLPALSKLLFQPPITQPSMRGDLVGTSFHSAAARFAKGDYVAKLTHLIGLVEAEFGTDCALWFVNERFQLRDVSLDGDEVLTIRDQAEELPGVSYELFEDTQAGIIKSFGVGDSSAPILSSSIAVQPTAATNPDSFKGCDLRLRVQWSGTVPNFTATVAKNLSAVLERYPATSVCDSILHAQGLGHEYLGRSVLAPLRQAELMTNEAGEDAQTPSHKPSQQEVDSTVSVDRAGKIKSSSGVEAEDDEGQLSVAVSEATVVDEGTADSLADLLMDTDANEMASPRPSISTTTSMPVAPDQLIVEEIRSASDDDVLDMILSGAAEVEPSNPAAELTAPSLPREKPSSSSLLTLAASPKPGVIDHIGKWVSRAAAQMERSQNKTAESLRNSKDGGSIVKEDLAKTIASHTHKFEVSDGWLATPEKAPVWTNRVDFDGKSSTKGVSSGGYSSDIQPVVMRLGSDRYNVSGSFVTHPHRKQTDQQSANWNDHDASKTTNDLSPPPAPFIFPDYYNSRTGKFSKLATDKKMWVGPNATSKEGVALNTAKIWRKGEREENARREALLTEAAAKAQLKELVNGGDVATKGKPSEEDTVKAALSVWFGQQQAGSDGGATATAPSLVGAPGSATSPIGDTESAINLPKEMSLSEFIHSFTEPDAVLAEERRKNAAMMRSLERAASTVISGMDVNATNTNNNEKPAGAGRSLSALLVASLAGGRTGSASVNDTKLAINSPKGTTTAVAARRKSHQRWFEVSLVAYPADLPSVATGRGSFRDVWMRPSVSSSASRPNTVKVAVSSSIASKYTEARTAASRQYLMSLVADLERLASR